MFQKKDSKGFTIIEVLIVLAIAGLILLVVFLAIPALQRNSRNTSRNNDAARISASITECMSNRNGVVTSCDSSTEIGFNQNDYAEIESVGRGSTAPTTTTAVNYNFSLKCTQDGSSATSSGASSRQFAVLFLTETANGTSVRCVGSE